MKQAKKESDAATNAIPPKAYPHDMPEVSNLPPLTKVVAADEKKYSADIVDTSGST